MSISDQRLETAKRICVGREERLRDFPEEMFSDSAWGMLLVLYICEHEGRECSKPHLYAEANVAHGAGIRWLRFLASEQLIQDIDAEMVSLTDAATDRLDRYLDAVLAIASAERPH